MDPFEFVTSINFTKKNLMVDDESESEYMPFLTNRSLSYFPDTIMPANDMNLYHQLDNKLQYTFLINTVRPRKRFSKWFKREVGDTDLLQRYYKCSHQVAEQYKQLLSEEQLEIIRTRMSKGGSNEHSEFATRGSSQRG